jgi:hypothetical protein
MGGVGTEQFDTLSAAALGRYEGAHKQNKQKRDGRKKTSGAKKKGM